MGASACLAFDLGATSWRAALGYKVGEDVRIERIHRAAHAPISSGDGLFWDFEGIMAGIIGVLETLGRQGTAIASIGIDAWSVDYGLLDAAGRLLEPPRCYRDPRNDGMLARMAGEIDLASLFRRTGVLAEDITTLCQLRAARAGTPALLREARALLFIPDLVRRRLCGALATDFTLAIASQLYCLARRDWDGELMARLGLPAGIMPPICPGTAPLGVLDPALQARTGLGPVPIVIGASHDTSAAFAAAGGDTGTAVLSSGTWSIIGANMGRDPLFDGIDPTRFGYEGNIDGTFRLVHNIPGMWILEQCMAEWAAGGEPVEYAALVEEARAAGATERAIDPHQEGFLRPRSMLRAIADYCRETHRRAPAGRGQVARAIFQGLADCYAEALAELQSITGRTFEALHVVGGGSRNALLNELTAAATGLAVRSGCPEASLMGNIRHQFSVMEGCRAGNAG